MVKGLLKNSIFEDMKKIVRKSVGFLLALVIFNGVVAQVTPNMLKDADKRAAAYSYADETLSRMTQDQKLAQLIMPMVWPKVDANSVSELNRLIDKGYGGILWQKGSPENVLNLTNRMRERAKIPMMTAMDGEWGLSMRFSGTISWPRNIVLGATNNIATAYEYGRATAEEAKRLGIHVNFAPVADVNNNAKNPVIGTRSFGSNPDQVSKMVIAYAQGMEGNGVLSVAKHFPGHGDTHVDSHKALPVINHTRERLNAVELVPFRAYINEGLGGMMMAHLTVPALDPSRKAASVSSAITTNLLQGELGFEGLIFTDALNMQGVLDGTGGKSAAVEAFKAGSDFLLAPVSPDRALSELKQALKSGEISMQEVDRKCRKILVWKHILGVTDTTPLPTNNLSADINSNKSKALQKRIHEESVTLLKNSSSLIPLSRHNTGKTALLRYGNTRTGTLLSTIKRYTPAESFTLETNASNSERNNVYSRLKSFDRIIVAVSSQNAREDTGLIELAQQKSVVLVFMTSPYTALSFQQSVQAASAVAMGYETKVEAQRAIGEALMGGITFEGQLPVDLSPLFKQGSKVETLRDRMSQTRPEEAGLDSRILSRIDQIAQEGIDKGAYPGCQVLVAKDGMIVYSKAFGHKDARKREPNNTKTLYDLASITKAVATTPLVMIADDEGWLSTQDQIGKHLPYLKGSNKEGLRVFDLLFHTGGMPAVIRFYFSLVDGDSYTSPLLSYKQRAGFPIQIDHSAWAKGNWKYDNRLVSRDSTEHFPIRFADGYYLHKSIRDSIQQQIRNANISPGRYRYSDIDFLLLQDILETHYGKPLDQLFEEQIARPLGTSRLLFKPYTRFAKNEIAEGQNDHFLRKQTLRGDVDDEAAAMLGGVSGNAGLYGNAEDLAMLLQMILNGGFYESTRYIDESTVKRYTTAMHRLSPYSLGFDRHRGKGKRGNVGDKAPLSTYGHTGFTGTCFWIDPDNNIIYIFLSNRIAPTRWNRKLSQLDIRTRIQDTIYDAFIN